MFKKGNFRYKKKRVDYILKSAVSPILAPSKKSFSWYGKLSLCNAQNRIWKIKWKSSLSFVKTQIILVLKVFLSVSILSSYTFAWTFKAADHSLTMVIHVYYFRVMQTTSSIFISAVIAPPLPWQKINMTIT